MSKITIADKIDALTSDDKARMAEELGISYDEVCDRLERTKKQSLYYRSDKAKAWAKAYREREKEKSAALKALL